MTAIGEKPMHFTFKMSNQLEYLSLKAHHKMFEGLQKGANKTLWIRGIGVFVGLASVFMTVVKQVAEIGETVIKGLGNIFGAFFSKKCNFLTGCRQIVVQLPIYTLSLCFLPLIILGSFLSHAVGFTLDPKKHSTRMLKKYENNMLEKRLDREVLEVSEKTNRNYYSLLKKFEKELSEEAKDWKESNPNDEFDRMKAYKDIIVAYKQKKRIE